MGDTAIPYATKAWNPVHGCSPAGEGCRSCWAKRVAETRLKGRGTYPADDPFRVVLDSAKLDEPLHWRKPQRVMTCSMGDLLHSSVDEKYIAKAFAIMDLARQHTYMLFTKRVERAAELFTDEDFQFHVGWFESQAVRELNLAEPEEIGPWPPKNVWIIASASTQAEVDRIVPVLLQIPAAKRGLSLEPLVEGVDLRRWIGHWEPGGVYSQRPNWGCGPTWKADLDWVIVGCESGPERRGMLLNWARVLRDQCVTAGVSFYLKQAVTNGVVTPHPQLDGREWMEIPDIGERKV